jgi:hypothetical protein
MEDEGVTETEVYEFVKGFVASEYDIAKHFGISLLAATELLAAVLIRPDVVEYHGRAFYNG